MHWMETTLMLISSCFWLHCNYIGLYIITHTYTVCMCVCMLSVTEILRGNGELYLQFSNGSKLCICI
jgi:hypothetical protein